MKTVMVSGNYDTTIEEFNLYYKPRIDKAIADGYTFVVGGNAGFENYIQNYLNNHVAPERVTVYDLHNCDNRVNLNFLHKSGFQSYRRRDSQMTIDSRVDIAFLIRDYYLCGTCENLERRELIKLKLRNRGDKSLSTIYSEAIYEAKKIISSIRNHIPSLERVAQQPQAAANADRSSKDCSAI